MNVRITKYFVFHYGYEMLLAGTVGGRVKRIEASPWYIAYPVILAVRLATAFAANWTLPIYPTAKILAAVNEYSSGNIIIREADLVRRSLHSIEGPVSPPRGRHRPPFYGKDGSGGALSKCFWPVRRGDVAQALIRGHCVLLAT